MARGISNILVTNEIIAPSNLDRLARLARQGTVAACVAGEMAEASTEAAEDEPMEPKATAQLH